MEPAPQKAYLSRTNTYLIICPSCRHSDEIGAGKLPPDTPNPFLHRCPCGVARLIQLVAFRASQRKPVNLVGSLTLSGDNHKFQTLCTVLDISAKGIGVATEPLKHVAQNTAVHASILLDDQVRTRLDSPCKVRRISPDKNRLVLGMEFVTLSPRQQQSLGSYLLL